MFEKENTGDAIGAPTYTAQTQAYSSGKARNAETRNTHKEKKKLTRSYCLRHVVLLNNYTNYTMELVCVFGSSILLGWPLKINCLHGPVHPPL